MELADDDEVCLLSPLLAELICAAHEELLQ